MAAVECCWIKGWMVVVAVVESAMLLNSVEIMFVKIGIRLCEGMMFEVLKSTRTYAPKDTQKFKFGFEFSIF